MAGWEFLSGLLSGVGDTYQRASEENRRISLLKKQLDQQNANIAASRAEAEADRQLRREEASADRELRKYGMGLDFLLGKGREALGYAGIDSQMALTLLQGAQQSGNIRLEAELREKLGDKAWAQGQIDADRQPGRAIAQARGIGAIQAANESKFMEQKRAWDIEDRNFADAKDRERHDRDRADKVFDNLSDLILSRAGGPARDKAAFKANLMGDALKLWGQDPAALKNGLAAINVMAEDFASGQGTAFNELGEVIEAYQRGADAQGRARFKSLADSIKTPSEKAAEKEGGINLLKKMPDKSQALPPDFRDMMRQVLESQGVKSPGSGGPLTDADIGSKLDSELFRIAQTAPSLEDAIATLKAEMENAIGSKGFNIKGEAQQGSAKRISVTKDGGRMMWRDRFGNLHDQKPP